VVHKEHASFRRHSEMSLISSRGEKELACPWTDRRTYPDTSSVSGIWRFCLMSFTCHWSMVGSLSKLAVAVAVNPDPLEAAATTVFSGVTDPILALIEKTVRADNAATHSGL